MYVQISRTNRRIPVASRREIVFQNQNFMAQSLIVIMLTIKSQIVSDFKSLWFVFLNIFLNLYIDFQSFSAIFLYQRINLSPLIKGS